MTRRTSPTNKVFLRLKASLEQLTSTEAYRDQMIADALQQFKKQRQEESARANALEEKLESLPQRETQAQKEVSRAEQEIMQAKTKIRKENGYRQKIEKLRTDLSNKQDFLRYVEKEKKQLVGCLQESKKKQENLEIQINNLEGGQHAFSSSALAKCQYHQQAKEQFSRVKNVIVSLLTKIKEDKYTQSSGKVIWSDGKKSKADIFYVDNSKLNDAVQLLLRTKKQTALLLNDDNESQYSEESLTKEDVEQWLNKELAWKSSKQSASPQEESAPAEYRQEHNADVTFFSEKQLYKILTFFCGTISALIFLSQSACVITQKKSETCTDFIDPTLSWDRVCSFYLAFLLSGLCYAEQKAQEKNEKKEQESDQQEGTIAHIAIR